MHKDHDFFRKQYTKQICLTDTGLEFISIRCIASLKSLFAPAGMAFCARF